MGISIQHACLPRGVPLITAIILHLIEPPLEQAVLSCVDYLWAKSNEQDMANRESRPVRNSIEGDLLFRIEQERHGVSMTEAETLRRSMGMSVNSYAPLLGMRPSLYKAKRTRRGRFTGAPAYAISDLGDMLRKVEGLVSADAPDFEVRRWFSSWIWHRQPALGGLAPAELLDTPTGRSAVTRVLGAMGSGAYL